MTQDLQQTNWLSSGRKLSTGLAVVMGVVLIASSGAAQTRPPRAQISETLPVLSRDRLLETRTFALRDGSEGATLTAFTPQTGHHTGAAVIIAPGGGYIGLAGNLEGRQVADWFAARGVTAFILRYRFGAAHPLPEPIFDGERAIRFVRAHAAELGVDADRIGMVGFSAGGHLAAMTVAKSDDGVATSNDPIERVSSRPDFLILGYPSIETTTISANGVSRYCRFARIARWDCRSEDYAAISPYPDIVSRAPSTFIYHTTNDTVVPVQDSLRLYETLAAGRVDVEMHIFAKGAHGSGLGGGDPSLSLWPQALDAWLRARGLLDPAVKAAAAP